MSNLLLPTAVLLLVVTSPGPVTGQEWAPATLGAEELVGIIGSLDGSPDEILGSVTDVAFDPITPSVFVLDGLSKSIKRFALDGTALGSVGRGGGGPGEFTAPSRIHFSLGELAVLDRAGRVTAFAVHAPGQAATFESDFRVAESLLDLCLIGSSAVIQTQTSFKTVDPQTGEVLVSIDASPRTGHSILDLQRVLGRLGCGADRFWFVDNATGTLTTRSADGGTSSTQRLDWFAPIEHVVEGRSVRNQISEEAGGYHRIENLVALPDGDLLVQAGFNTLESVSQSRRFAQVRSVRVARSGELTDLGTTIPLILAATDTHVLTYDAESIFPRVLVWRRAGSN